MLFNLFPPDEFSYWWPYALGGITIAIILIIAVTAKNEEKENITSE